MDKSTVTTIDDINDLIEKIESNAVSQKRKYDDIFIKYTALLNIVEFYKEKVKDYDMSSRGMTGIEYEDMVYDGGIAIPSLGSFAGANTTITTSDNILNGAQRLNMVVLENNVGTFTNVRRDANGAYIISQYSNEITSRVIPFKITNPFDFNVFAIDTKTKNDIVIRIGSTQYESEVIVFPEVIDEHEITVFISFPSESYIENNTNEFSSYKYIQTIMIDKIVTGNITTEANFSTIQKIDKYAQDYILRGIKINDGYNFDNTFYTGMLVEFARDEENAKSGLFFKSIVVPSSGSVNEVINEYAGTAEQWVRISISDNIKPILLKNVKLQYSIR